MNENNSPQAPGQSAPSPSYHEERLSIPQNIRITGGVFLAVLAGMSLGSSHGGKMAGMRFRAENSHRFPKSQAGWFLYHKSKNYHVMLGGLKEGFKMGTKVGIWTGGFLGVESFVDEKRGSKDFLSSAVAGLSTAIAFSLWNKFPLMTAMRTARTGLYSGIAFGFVQDALGLLRGRHLRYIDSLVDTLGLKGRHSETKSPRTIPDP